MIKIVVKNHSRYTYDSVRSLVVAGVRGAKTRCPAEVTVHVNDARGGFPRVATISKSAMRLYLPKPKESNGGGFYDYLDLVDEVAALRLVRWAALILSGLSRNDLNNDQKSLTGPTPWAGIHATPRVRLTKQAPNKEAGAAKLHASKIKKAENEG